MRCSRKLAICYINLLRGTVKKTQQSRFRSLPAECIRSTPLHSDKDIEMRSSRYTIIDTNSGGSYTRIKQT